MSYSQPKKLSKYIPWMFKRHPYLYFIRFRLLSKNSDKVGILNNSYNLINLRHKLPKIFEEVNGRIFPSGASKTNDLEKVKTLSVWLNTHIKGGPGLSLSSGKALQTMLAGKGGVCSDMAQVFNNFCVVNALKVREWGVTIIPFNDQYGGHSFNEVYCDTLNKWVFVDVSHCLLFYDDGQKEPLSVIELYELVRQGKLPRPYFFYPEHSTNEKIITDYYHNPKAAPFLICNYSNRVYDAFLSKLRAFTPVFIIHFLIFCIGKSYYYKFPLDDYKQLFS